ncbi:MAG: T9SS type A sorting domain-containing protein [Ignavibacteriales bacterium]|jgi:hypothetical protein|nr:MAG: T9SS type A sorting domain-containing protein [Ignavibacteriaceae bacterium]MBW7872635.1 T9SS type A sorting domain-containing protein [Ignavibacteria bacterium]MCZ2141811.1 T9SS type A sorting domain-containing protein [Ignavibacteriales bacterium]OQY75610.1 MAG: hypothetical protein B6D45_05470 [Ignavibacteriales bacterium UTCHB3]MBV6444980.1 hypothetical protein [Ignavibacteriaceae bacterium]
MGATSDDFSIEFERGTDVELEGFSLGRFGFNSFPGIMLNESSAFEIVYATNITDFNDIEFVTIGTVPVNETETKGKLEASFFGNDATIKVYVDNILKATIPISNVPQELRWGHLLMQYWGDGILKWEMKNIDIRYNPYIGDAYSEYNEPFIDPLTPWIKIGSWDVIGQNITIENNQLRFNFPNSGNEIYSLLTGSPLPAVEDYSFTITGTGDFDENKYLVGGRMYSWRYFTGITIGDDTISIIYNDGGDVDENPKTLVKTHFQFTQPTNTVTFKSQRNGNTINITVLVNSVTALTGSLNTSDSRLHRGQLYIGLEGHGAPGWMAYSNASITFNRIPTDVSDENFAPKSFDLSQNYPNPFNPSTVIKYSIDKPGKVRLTVHDLLGRECAVLVDEDQISGAHEVVFDAARLAGGVYFYRLSSGGENIVRKMVLLK